jgi:phage I-like protein
MIAERATPHLALCSDPAEAASGAALALCEADGAPEWIQLLPAGPQIAGRDGRCWTMNDPLALVEAFNAEGAPLPVDWEHAQHIAAPQGRPAPAAGWIEAIEARGDGVWGRVDWTARGREAVASREYRFISPAFTFAASGEIARLKGAGLVNRPNLRLAALNHEESHMDKELLKALGLAAGATLADAIAKADELTVALNRSAAPDPAAFVPRADYQLAMNRAAQAEEQIAAIRREAHEAEISAEVEAAVKAGKIAPASRDYHLATCRNEGGLALFKKLVAESPSLFTTTKTEGDPELRSAVCAEERDALERMGIGVEEYLKVRG